MGPKIRNAFWSKSGGKKFRYSSGFGGWIWTKEKLNKFLEDPEEFDQNTAMVFPGIQDPVHRAAVIEYLHKLRVELSSKEARRSLKR
mmetsp:Transcript_25887/g.22827  ORF Transcript_25887/g.22827 Transcript_25887/m.22827 type:complete len:87 (-) Transcript_25887:62-322(-)